MRCHMCNVNKLSREFPPIKVTEKCRHPRFFCMRCVIAYVGQHHKCPQPSCEQPVAPDSHVIKRLESTLDHMFTVYTSDYTPPCTSEAASQGIIRVAVLNGDSINISYNPHMTILQLKEQIRIKLKHEIRKQKLLYNDKELKMHGENGKQLRLSDHNVPANSTVYLVILLYAIPENFDHVIFDLFWGYPFFGRDYLDASCLVFSGLSFQGVQDFRRKYSCNNLIRHSGDVMNDALRQGHHTIHVHLKMLPNHITHLFFTLSAWNSPNISRYPNPSLKFFEASDKNKDLCKTTFTHAKSSEAVVMCSMS